MSLSLSVILQPPSVLAVGYLPAAVQPPFCGPTMCLFLSCIVSCCVDRHDCAGLPRWAEEGPKDVCGSQYGSAGLPWSELPPAPARCCALLAHAAGALPQRPCSSPIPMPDPLSSRAGANKTTYVYDLGSKAGTRIDGKLVPPKKAVLLPDGAMLTVGSSSRSYILRRKSLWEDD